MHLLLALVMGGVRRAAGFGFSADLPSTIVIMNGLLA